jgi:hypothetical protein
MSNGQTFATSPFGEDVSAEEIFRMFFGGAGGPGFGASFGGGGPGAYHDFLPSSRFNKQHQQYSPRLLDRVASPRQGWEDNTIGKATEIPNHVRCSFNFSLY